MEQKDVVAIFNEMLTKVYSEQEEKYKRKRILSCNVKSAILFLQVISLFIQQ